MHVIPISRAVKRRDAPQSPSGHAPEPARTSPRPAIALLAIAALLAGGAVALRNLRGRAAPAYRTETVMRGPVIGVLRLPGQLQAQTTVRVGSVLPGQVTDVGARVGDRVRRGQVLARLDDLEQRAAVAAGGAALTLARVRGVHAEKRLLEMLAALQAEGALPGDVPLDELLEGEAGDAQLELTHALAQVANQEQALAVMKQLLARRVIRAPMAGVVLERSVERDETVGASPPGPPLFVIGSDPGALRLRVEVDDAHVARVRPGTVTFRVAAHPGRAFSGDVRSVSALAVAGGTSPARYALAIDADNADGALAPGMSAIVEVPMTSPEGGLRVRATALGAAAEGPAGAAAAWRLDAHGRPTPITVETGVSDGRFVEIRGGGVGLGTRLVVD